MALTDENGGSPFTMPVAPMYGGGNGGFGYGGDWAWILLLLLIGGNGWGFGGGFGGAGALAADGAMLYPWMNQAELTQNGFRDQMINTNIEGIKSGLGDISTQLCAGFAGVEQGANARQMANMQTAFDTITNMNAGFTGLQSSLANCCCENRLATADLKYAVAQENCADRQAISDGIRDLLAATQAQTQAILTQMCDDKIEQKNDTIAQLRSELLYARGQASQDVQTATIQAGQRALANEVEQYVAPKASPCYVVANPNCCPSTSTCGCGSF